jgi:hypothetical protein
MVDAPLAGLAFFGGWIVLLVASDIAALLKWSAKRSSQVQNALLLGSIAATLAFGTAAYTRAHGRPQPCARESGRSALLEPVRDQTAGDRVAAGHAARRALL